MQAELEQLRQQIAALQSERDAVLNQKRSRADAAKLFGGLVDSWLAAGERQVETEIRRAALGAAPDLLMARVNAPVINGTAHIAIDLAPLLTAIVGRVAIEKVIADALSKITAGLPAPKRAAKLTELAKQLDALEVQEERLCAEHGFDRRPDARPEIILSHEVR